MNNIEWIFLLKSLIVAQGLKKFPVITVFQRDCYWY